MAAILSGSQCVNPSNGFLLCIQDSNLAITVYADALAANCARASVERVLIEKK